MNNKGEFKIQGMLIGLLFVGLFMGYVGITIDMMGGNYDITGSDLTDITKYNKNANLSTTLDTQAGIIDETTIDKSLFDYLAGIFATILKPFQFIYGSYTIMQSFAAYAVSDLQVMSIVSDFAIASIVVLVIIGIVMIKFYLGRRK
jgi:hypothetical protein